MAKICVSTGIEYRYLGKEPGVVASYEEAPGSIVGEDEVPEYDAYVGETVPPP